MTTPGALIAGRYRLHNRVASGGMGSVWEAEDEVLGRRVAVKMLLSQPGTSPTDADTARNRVIREARITARLHHPHAVTIYDVVEHAGQPCLIMQFVPSRSLNALLQEQGVLPERTAVRIGAELASALTAAHLAGIVHRDIKPSNVLITEDGSAKLTDFGISHATGDVTLTSTGMVSGTPAYLAPEVARGAPSNFPADVFSLGATLYASLEGAPPFGTDVNPMAILHRVASGQIVLPRRSGALTPLLLHMLAPQPGNRPTMAEVARSLAEAADQSRIADRDRPTTALPPPTVREWPVEPPRPATVLSAPVPGAAALPDPPGASPVDLNAGPAPERRRRVLLGAVVALVVIGVVVLGIALLSRGGRSDGVAGSSGSTPPAVSAGQRTTPTDSQGTAPNGGPVAPAGSATARSSARSSAAASVPAVPLPAATRVAATSRSSSTSAPATTSATKTTGPATTAARTTSAPSASRSSTSSSTTVSTTGSTTNGANTGAPTADQLAAAVTDYYAGMPSATDDGWAHLTDNFRTTIAHGRANYQSFWDGIASVSLSDVQGTAPGTVEATVTYRLTDGSRSVERTRYRLVSQDGTLKIDSSEIE